MPEDDPRQDLRADCGACAALCCVAPPFAVSADFPINKPAGTPCPHLTLDYRCGIHERLRLEGFSGCAAFDCFGAGQRTTHLMGDLTWRTHPGAAGRMFGVFEVLRPLHEILWYLEEACGRLPDGELRAEARERRQHTRSLAASSPDELIATDVVAQRAETGVFLEQVSRVLRGDTEMGIDLRGADLAGRRLRRADLRRARPAELLPDPDRPPRRRPAFDRPARCRPSRSRSAGGESRRRRLRDPIPGAGRRGRRQHHPSVGAHTAAALVRPGQAAAGKVRRG